MGNMLIRVHSVGEIWSDDREEREPKGGLLYNSPHAARHPTQHTTPNHQRPQTPTATHAQENSLDVGVE